MGKWHQNEWIDQEIEYTVKMILKKLNKADSYKELQEELNGAVNVFVYKYDLTYKKVIHDIWKENADDIENDIIDEEVAREINNEIVEEIYSREINNVDYQIANLMIPYIHNEGMNFLEAWEKTRKELVDGEFSIKKLAEDYKQNGTY